MGHLSLWFHSVSHSPSSGLNTLSPHLLPFASFPHPHTLSLSLSLSLSLTLSPPRPLAFSPYGPLHVAVTMPGLLKYNISNYRTGYK